MAVTTSESLCGVWQSRDQSTWIVASELKATLPRAAQQDWRTNSRLSSNRFIRQGRIVQREHASAGRYRNVGSYHGGVSRWIHCQSIDVSACSLPASIVPSQK